MKRVAHVLLCVLLATPALAQSDEAIARQLFDEGRKLMDENKFEQACPKFEEGVRLMPGVGMKFNLGECYERSGRLASAWAAFLDAASLARAQNQPDREHVARRRAAALESEIGRITVSVDKAADVPGLEVRRDGTVVGRGQWGSAIPADAGPHVIVASATGRITWQTTVRLADGDSKPVNVPVLAIDPTASAQARAIASLGPPEEIGRGRRTAGLVTGVVGAVGLATGAIFGVLATYKAGQSGAHCYPGNICDATGVSERNDAITFANASTVTLVASAAVFIAGVVIYLTAPSAQKHVQGGLGGLVLRF